MNLAGIIGPAIGGPFGWCEQRVCHERIGVCSSAVRGNDLEAQERSARHTTGCIPHFLAIETVARAIDRREVLRQICPSAAMTLAQPAC
jgi:hypothetical protein